MAARTVDGPDKDWLDMSEIAHLTRMSESTIRRLVETGDFPRPKEITGKLRLWHWTDYLYWTMRVERRDRLIVGPMEEEK
jgi:predicted DNA-binding transcriptional regulator AlpA